MKLSKLLLAMAFVPMAMSCMNDGDMYEDCFHTRQDSLQLELFFTDVALTKNIPYIDTYNGYLEACHVEFRPSHPDYCF